MPPISSMIKEVREQSEQNLCYVQLPLIGFLSNTCVDIYVQFPFVFITGLSLLESINRSTGTCQQWLLFRRRKAPRVWVLHKRNLKNK